MVAVSKDLYRRLPQSGQPASAPASAPRVRRIAEHTSRQDEANFDQDGNYNPRPLGRIGRDGVDRSTRGAQSAQRGRAYNDRGEINANDNREAVEQAAHLVGNVLGGSDGEPRMDRTAAREERMRRNAVLRTAMLEPGIEGMHLIGQELALPLKDILDYEGFTAQVFRVRSIEQGEFFRVPRDYRSTAHVIGQDGQLVESRATLKWVQPDKFKIGSSVTVDITEIYEATYDLLERAKQTAEQEIMRERDKRTIALIDRASQTQNIVTGFSTVGPAVLEAMRYQIERHGLVVDKYLISRQEVSDVVTTMAAGLDPVSQRELHLQGVFGRFLGANIMTASGQGVNEVIPAGTMYAVTAPEFLGELGIYVDLFSEAFNKFPLGETVKGWIFLELVGMCLPNHKSCSKALRS